jgi:hypothetical protein
MAARLWRLWGRSQCHGGEHSYRTATYLLSFATSVRAFVFIVVPFIIVPVFPLVFFVFLLLVLFFFFPPTLLVVFAAGVTKRSSLRVSLHSTVARMHK